MSSTSGHKTYVTFPILHLYFDPEFDHNWPTDIRNILLLNGPKRPDHYHSKASLEPSDHVGLLL